MPVDYYPNLTVEELEARLLSLQNRSTKGEVYFTTSAGVQTQKSYQGAARPEVEIRRVLYSLHLRDESSYPDDPYAGRIRRTRASYT